MSGYFGDKNRLGYWWLLGLAWWQFNTKLVCDDRLRETLSDGPKFYVGNVGLWDVGDGWLRKKAQPPAAGQIEREVGGGCGGG